MVNNIFQAQRHSLDDALLTSSSNDELVDEYLAWKQSHTSAAFRVYRTWVERFQAFINKPPEQLRHIDYTAFANSLHGRYASSCIELALSAVHNYLFYFAEQGRLRFPLSLARVPRGVTNSHEAITEEEYRTLVRTIRAMYPTPKRDLAIIMLLHDTGLRIGELLSLELGDIEEDRSAVVRTEKSARFRRVFWNVDTDAVLQQFLVERVNTAQCDSDVLFVSDRSRTGNAITSRTVERTLKRMLVRSNIQRDLCPHSFRHSFIHRLAKLGVPDAIIAQLVGHSTPTTVAHYTKLSRPEFKEYALKQLAWADEVPLAMAA